MPSATSSAVASLSIPRLRSTTRTSSTPRGSFRRLSQGAACFYPIGAASSLNCFSSCTPHSNRTSIRAASTVLSAAAMASSSFSDFRQFLPVLRFKCARPESSHVVTLTLLINRQAFPSQQRPPRSAHYSHGGREPAHASKSTGLSYCLSMLRLAYVEWINAVLQELTGLACAVAGFIQVESVQRAQPDNSLTRTARTSTTKNRRRSQSAANTAREHRG